MSEPRADAKAIFLAALECEGAEALARFLEQACGADAVLRQRVEELLHANRDAGRFLGGDANPATCDEPYAASPGTVIGPYKLIEPIGEGGMGSVWMAQQTDPVKRLVAVKLIKPGMDSRQIIARFEAERQALALMDHANIARVLDAGTTGQGRPYFVMDLVKGVPITKYCDQHHLTPRERLELFLPVCQAIQHAHQKGIIHRDLKPSNVLVALYDGRPVPKIIDFGVAKATGQPLTEKTLATGFGAIVGTLEYMSPEQAELNQLDIDTRSDIYSLGVLLYELLTGSTPFSRKQLDAAGMLEMLRVIREQEPSKPSTKLGTAEGLPTLAANRSTEPARLTRLVRGELDWIVMKALEKDRTRRYETANGFAMDIQRYLADEAVLACPPSAAYRFRKFARRNKGPVLAASLVLLSLVVGIIGATWGVIRATEAEAEALFQAKQKGDALIEKESALATARANEQAAKTNEAIAKTAQEEAVENLEHALAAVEQMLFRVGNDRLANVPQMETVRQELVADALTFYEKFLDKHDANPLIQQRTAMVRIHRANLHRVLGQFAEAETCFRTGFAAFDEVTANSQLEPDTRSQLLRSHISFAQCLIQLGKTAEAEMQLRIAVELAEGLAQEFPDDPRRLEGVARANNSLVHLILSDRPEEAGKILRRNLALARDDFNLGRTYHHLGILASREGRHTEALAAFRRALELQEAVVRRKPTDTGMQAYLGNTLNLLAGSLAANNRLKEAEEVSAKAVFVWDKLAEDYPAVEKYQNEQPTAHWRRAGLLDQLGLTAEAAIALRRSMKFAINQASDHPDVPKYRQLAWRRCLNLGQFLLKAGDVEEAQQVFSRCELFLQELDGDAPARFRQWQELCNAYIGIGWRFMMQGNTEEIHASCRKLVALLDKLEVEYGGQGEYRGDLALSSVSLGWLLHEAGLFINDREKLARRAQAHLQAVAKQLSDDLRLRVAQADSHHQLGIVLARPAGAEEAETELRQAALLYEKLAREFPEVPGQRSSLAHVYNKLGWGLRDKDELAAEQEHRRALALFEALSDELPDNPWHQSHRAMMLETVGVLRRDRGDFTSAKALLEQAIIHAQKACDLNSSLEAFHDRLRSSRAELEKTLNVQKPEKIEIPQ